MSEIAHAASTIFKRAGKAERFMVAIAGPPGSGKSTLAAALADLLPESSSIVVPMDGFHFDDVILAARGWSSRKGAAHTFDVAGLEVMLRRIRSREPDVAIPIFDRNMELSRAAAAIVDTDKRFILVEGLYLLLDEEPWSRLAPLFDFSIFIDVPRAELERRLVQRWREHGRSDDDARNWIDTNDLPNVERVLGKRRVADLTM